MGSAGEALEKLEKHSWPGNVRELENIIEGTMNVMDGKWIQVEDLPHYLQKRNNLDEKLTAEMASGEILSLKELMKSMEKRRNHQSLSPE